MAIFECDPKATSFINRQYNQVDELLSCSYFAQIRVSGHSGAR